MCPLRFILLFLSAILAGYFAFKSVQSDQDPSVVNLSEDEPEQATEETSLLTKVSAGIASGFWVMVDMLSGRYLYKNLKGQTQAQSEGVELREPYKEHKLDDFSSPNSRCVLRQRPQEHHRPSFEHVSLLPQDKLKLFGTGQAYDMFFG